MDVLWVKVICLFCTLALALIFGTLPYFTILRNVRSDSSSASRRNRIIKLFNCFAGGVFLGALFLDMLLEGAEEFDKYKVLIGFKSDFPLFNVIVITGFFFTSSIEYFAHMLLDHRHASSVVENQVEKSESLQNSNKREYGSIGTQSIMTPSPTIPRIDYVDRCRSKDSSLESDALLHHAKDVEIDRTEETDLMNRVARLADSNPTDGAHQIKSILLLLALSFHSIFDGLALGLQDTASQVWEVFAAVAIHKCIVSFCLGLDVFVSSSNPKIAAAYMAIFSLISPVGTSIGISLTSTGIDVVAQRLASSVLQGVACGAFLYVTFMEILSSSWKTGHRSFLDIICAFCGFTVMVIAVIWD